VDTLKAFFDFADYVVIRVIQLVGSITVLWLYLHHLQRFRRGRSR
jgi:hypothetical protein